MKTKQAIRLDVHESSIRLMVDRQTWRFSRHQSGSWMYEGVEVDDILMVSSLTPEDGFILNGGLADSYQIIANSNKECALRFILQGGCVTYSVYAGHHLACCQISLDINGEVTVAHRTYNSDKRQHGAWVTRGEVASDAEGKEVFIDGSGPVVFGHSSVGSAHLGYVVLAEVNPNIPNNGRTEQRSNTWFMSGRAKQDNDEYYGYWKLRIGADEPKQFAVVFDTGLPRFHDVCEKYYSDVVDTLVNLFEIPSTYDPDLCLQLIPLRLSAPDAFIPGYGWMMSEYPNPSYPYATDSSLQIAALLAYEGLATGRAWEKNYARYLLSNTPIEGMDGESYFVRRPGGLVRWGYASDYKNRFPRMDGGVWWTADILYHTALVIEDENLRMQAFDMVMHDLHVKLDLENMSFPPCWNAKTNNKGVDDRDDWFKTPGLAWCAYAAVHIAYPETKDTAYIAMADRICGWFAERMHMETTVNYLQGTNMYATFSFYLILMFFDQYDRTSDPKYLDLALDIAWIHIMTSCITSAKDSFGNHIAGATCVGIRGCVDYDCSPHLCQEKDLNFIHMIGPLLDHVSGAAYSKYMKLQQLVLKKDAWDSAWVTELRDTNLRTMYDTYARGMANLVYAINHSSNPLVSVVEKMVSKCDSGITHRRDMALANATRMECETNLSIRYLYPGIYSIVIDGIEKGWISSNELNHGVSIRMAPNTLKSISARYVKAAENNVAPTDSSISKFPQFDQATVQPALFLSDMEPFAMQRGTGLPTPVFRMDRSFGGNTLSINGRQFDKGLGCATNTTILYDLGGRFRKFRAFLGVDDEVANAVNPPASIHYTMFADGELFFDSGPVYSGTDAIPVDTDISGVQMLMLRLSGNWDYEGDTRNDHGDWADAHMEF